MWQRLQSLFLAGVPVVVLVLFVVPVYHVVGKVDVAKPNLTLLDAPFVLALSLLPALLAIFTISRFKNRPLQMRLCSVGMLLSAAVLALILFVPALVPAFPNTTVTYAIGIYFLPATVLLFFLAGRFVRRDEELVRSADRLR